MKKKAKFYIAGLTWLAISLASAATSFADMMIMPMRVDFKDSERVKSIAVINTSAEAATFRVSFLNKRQIETGGYQDLKEPLDPKYDLSKMLVFSPRQVNLPPQGKQAIRLSLRRPPDLPDGEYRTHVEFMRITGNEAHTLKGTSASIIPTVGFAIPVILRKGKYDTTAKITSAKYIPAGTDRKGRKTPPKLEVGLERSGKYSAIGKIEVYWKPNGGNEVYVGQANTINIFHELNKRTADAILNNENISGGTFRVVFQGADTDKGRKFDEKTFPGP